MTKQIGIWVMSICFMGGAVLAEDYDPNLYIFTGEIDNYMEVAREMIEKPDADQGASVQELQEIAARIARVYFASATTDIKPKMDQHLGSVLKSNPELENYFVFLGNAYLEQAQAAIERDQNHRKSIRVKTTIGGAVVGLAVAGGYLYIRAKGLPVGTHLGARQWITAAVTVLGLSGAGYVGGKVYAYQLPANISVKNAKDFKVRYPNGEDYLKEIQKNLGLGDIAMRLNRGGSLED